MGEELILDHDDLHLLHRHYINLTCVDSGQAVMNTNGGKPVRYNFSAFVVRVEAVMLAITAGHVFSDIKKAIAAGSIISNWAIDDSMVNDHGHPVYPIDLDLKRNVFSFDIEGIDYGAYVLSSLEERALTKSGIVPIEKEQWDAEDLSDFPFWTLIGLPTQFAELHHDGPSVKNHVTVRLICLEDPPPGLAGKKYERLYARVVFESVAEHEHQFDIGGMSGGPIFGTRSAPQGNGYDYRLIAIQSSWDERGHVAMCPAQPFLRVLANTIKESAETGAKLPDR